MDFAGAKGSEVIAVANGVVVFAGYRDGYGQMVEISHGKDLRTRYGHHEEVLVHAGQSVKRGDVIALMGNSGRSTGPHVHFEVLKEGRPVNPARCQCGGSIAWLRHRNSQICQHPASSAESRREIPA